ncbi:MAG: AI-2E family transporter [Candidatus Zixiibacteriota bacterium]|nr:MAG: AI-2E family transporter [candidate division Zixibacteria bacterium]
MPNGSRLLTINQVATPLLTIAALTALCYFAAPILVPIVTAATLTYILWPGVAALKKLKIPHVLAVIIIMLLAITALTAIGMLIYSEAVTFSDNLPTYWEQLQQLRTDHAKDLPKIFDFLGQDSSATFLNGIDATKLSAIPKFLFKGVGSILSFLGQAILIVLITLFMLFEQPGFHKRVVRSLGSDNVSATADIISQISAQIAGFLWVRFVVTVGLAIVFSIGLLIGGINYPYVWGPLAALLNLVPYAGAYIGAIPPMIMAYIQHGSFLPAVWVFVFFMAVQFIESNILTPKMLGRQLNINLLAQLISTIYWGWLWGAIGIVLAVPITAALKVVCDHLEVLHPIGILLSGDDN